MQMNEFRFSYQIYPGKEALSPADQSLMETSIQACDNAYAPYSAFRVGVAIRTMDQKIISGSNQENGAFPIGQCAERVALYNMIHAYGRLPVDTIAIAVDHADQLKPASPCGSCRQMLNEYRSYQTQPIRLLLGLTGGGEIYEINDVGDLLPLAFDGSFLGQ
jgi:cytidine deaminase